MALCNKWQIPFVYDVHHHRCLPDSLTEEEVSLKAVKTWNREPLFHMSSPAQGWRGKRPQEHAGYIDVADFPLVWQKIPQLTVEVEAKNKELAIARLIQDLQKEGVKILNPVLGK